MLTVRARDGITLSGALLFNGRDMACGGCAERREAMRGALQAVASGDAAELARQVEAFSSSARRDAAAVTSSARTRAAALVRSLAGR